ncbi:MAG: DNA primase [Pelosinus sp.]|nr:DNA primase [Pelosinus sp.]
MRDVGYDDFIDRLRAESDIVRIISDYVPLKKKGKNYWGCCPFHHEKTPSFSVTPDKGFFYCFGCQNGGNVFNFLMKVENIGFIDAVKLLAQKMNIPIPQREKSPEELARDKERARLYQANELARDFFCACLTKTKYGELAREYLTRRGITSDIIVKFGLGFAPDAWDKLLRALEGRSIAPEVLLKAGLALNKSSGNGCYDRFRNRVMFPISNPRGHVVGFGGRVLDDSKPKYLNSPETTIFNKRPILYGFHIADSFIRQTGQAVVVEGYMDAITAHAAGISNVVASLGTAFTLDQARLLRNASEIVFAYDSDTAGQSATARAMDIANKLGAKVRVVSIPDGKDPDEFIRKHGRDAFCELVANSLPILDYQISQAFFNVDYSNLEGKVQVVARAVPALAASENAVEVNGHIASLAETLAIDEGAIRSEVSKFLLHDKKDKNVKTGKNINMVSLTNKEDTALDQAERSIIRFMCDDSTMVPYVKAKISAEDLKVESRRQLADLLFSTYSKGETSADWTNSLNEAVSSELSHIMLMNIQTDDITKTIDDCVKTIQITKLNLLYEQHRLQADELERMGDSSYLQELAESQRIKNEINKLHSL